MTRYLIVANEALGGEALADRVRQAVEAGSARFFVLVPIPESEQGSAAADGGTTSFAGVADPATRQATDGPSAGTEAAQGRLNRAFGRLRELGADVDGQLGEPDVMEAIARTLEQREVDEIILVTPPAAGSQLIAMDLPSRVERAFNLPVQQVTAEASASGE